MADALDITTALGDRYVIEREIGSGGMAVVYLARDKKLDRQVALKVLRPELGVVLGPERFLAEIKISARLDHPHILTLIDSGELEGILYYVLPYVRGESLRAKIERERQLTIDEALTIIRQVASALDYAHRQGFVHRDIKPENVLLQEGEAMLTDFGIALAVKEAGGNRLTQTGLSLGTPQYMSPEQATGDRRVDARSDVYSLAAVLYEMLSGEPPVTGATAQSIIAKLMTEKPTPLRVIRDTVPQAVDAAVLKALEKTPADRYASAGDFVRALDAKSTTSQVGIAPKRRTFVVAGLAVLAALAASAYAARHGKPSAPVKAVLEQRTQLTTFGGVQSPSISPDGKQIAYMAKHCGSGKCSYSVVLQDVGGSVTRTIMEGATSSYWLRWSPDRRNLIFYGGYNGHIASHLLSALGGAPRLITPGISSFYAGGDSLLLGPALHSDSVFWIRVASLDGVVHDSLPVRGQGEGIQAISNVPGTQWIVTVLVRPPHGLWQVMDRSGRVADQIMNSCTCGGLAASDAVWLERQGDGAGQSIVRVALDPLTGKFATRQDTMITGLYTSFSLTTDGATLVMDEGTFEFSVWGMDFADAMKGKYADDTRIARASSPLAAQLSPDGARILLRRSVSTGDHVELRYSIVPFGSSAETPLPGATPIRASWVDSVTLLVLRQMRNGTEISKLDVRTGATRDAVTLPDSTIGSFTAIPGGIAYLPADQSRIIVRQNGKTREIARPERDEFIMSLAGDATGRRVFVSGIDRTVGDTMQFDAVSLDDGKATPLLAAFAEGGRITPLADGAAFIELAPSQDALSLYKVTAQDRVQHLGDSPRPIASLSVSRDLKRVVALERDYRADAWLSHVVKH